MTASFDAGRLVGLRSERRDIVNPDRVQDFAVVLDVRPGPPVPPVPPGFHWTMFGSFPKGVRVDGHPLEMKPFPRLPFERRMWAGGQIVWHGALRAGQEYQRSSVVEKADFKEGRAGRFLATSTRHHLTQDQDGLVIDERHDVVFLEADTRPGRAPGQPLDFTAEWEESLSPTIVTLFRYSALTFNSHRIHYDYAYATEAEKYAGIVVHGPLIATSLMLAARRHAGRELRTFNYRGRRPVFLGATVTMVGVRDGEGCKLAAVDEAGTIAMEASATF